MTARRRAALCLALLASSALVACRPEPIGAPPHLAHVAALPQEPGSVRFAVIGDSGTGGREQNEVAARLTEAHEAFPFTFVLMLGDNLYGLERASDYVRKFEAPYGELLRRGVRFHAALGNHDQPNQRFYERFHMDGQRYYSFREGDARFFALDSNYMDDRQLDWLAQELRESDEPWKICFFHHPLYSSGARHGSEVDLRERLEPLFVEHGVTVVFAGHEHFYERTVPQKGVVHFIAGAAAKLRRGNILRTVLTARGFDEDHSFMLVEIAGDVLHFEAIARSGALIDAGQIVRRSRASEAAEAPSGGRS